MKTTDLLNLIVLGAIWGVSFMFIRVAAPEFGPVALMAIRVVLASLVLVPLLLARKAAPEMIRHWQPIATMGVLHYAIPFCLFGYSMLTITGGLSAIINASSPLFTGAIAWLVLKERLDAPRIIGLFVGFAGVVVLVWDKLVLNAGTTALAIVASVLASFFYGIAAVFARKRLAGVSPTAVSAGSMVAASVLLLPVSFWLWPQVAPSGDAWAMAVLLGVLCTAVAFLLYFRLIANVGPTRAITVTFLIPVFAVLFGALFIGEELTRPMILGGIVILVGTSLSTGLLKFRA